MTEVIRFYQGDRYRGRWVLYSRGNDTIRAETLVGQIVNIGTRDGRVFDSASVTDFDSQSGVFTIEGGVNHPSVGDLEPTGREQVSIRDIARGYIHREPEDGALVAARVAPLQAFLLNSSQDNNLSGRNTR